MTFGRYLLNRKLVTTDQLLDALKRQQRETPLMGEVAEEVGLITNEQHLYILDSMASEPGLTFAEAARDLAMLTRSEIEWLTARQQSGRPKLGALLVRDGVVTDQAIEDALRGYTRRAA